MAELVASPVARGTSGFGDGLLPNTKVTDAALEHLKGLTKLQTLYLNGTRVTDVGLEHLKGLAKLRDLNLGSPR